MATPVHVLRGVFRRPYSFIGTKTGKPVTPKVVVKK